MKLFQDLLEAQGYAALQTRDGLEALKLAREHRPDMILMDIQLPEISGLEVTKRLKEDYSLRGIPVIAVTAFAMKGDEEKIRQADLRDVLPRGGLQLPALTCEAAPNANGPPEAARDARAQENEAISASLP